MSPKSARLRAATFPRPTSQRLMRPLRGTDTRLGWLGGDAPEAGRTGSGRALGQTSAPGGGVLALLLGLAVLAGCAATNPARDEGDDHLAAGRYADAVAAYERAQAADPEDRDLAGKLDEARRAATAARLDRAEGHFARGELIEAGEALLGAGTTAPRAKRAERLASLPAKVGAEPGFRALAERIAGALDGAVHERELAMAAFEGGDPITAWEILERHAGARSVAEPAEVARVRGAAIAALEKRAAERIRAGEVEAANADLAAARALAAGGAPGAAASPGPRAGGPRGGEGARPAPGAGAAGSASGAELQAYAAAAGTIERLTDGLPRRRPGGGLAQPEDYAVSEDEARELRAAVEEAMRLRPAGEAQPRWLGRGRLVLQFTNEVMAKQRLEDAARLVAAGELGAGLARAASVQELDRDILDDPEVAERSEAVRRQAATALVESAERAADRGFLHLARLRAEQAREVSPEVEPRARGVLDRARLQSRSPSVVLFPFQDYTERGGVGARLVDQLRRDLDGKAVGPLLTFPEYTEGKRAGTLPPLAGVLRGDVLRFHVREVEDERAALARQVEVLEERLREARRRVTATPDRAARLVALEEVDDLERELARTRRKQSASLLASGAPASQPERQVVATLEVRFGMYAGEGGAPLVEEVLTRTRTGPASASAATEDGLFAEAVERLGQVVADRLRRAGEGVDTSAIRDPLARLDAEIAELSRRAALPDRDRAIASVLESTGYSFALGRTIPERLVIRAP